MEGYCFGTLDDDVDSCVDSSAPLKQTFEGDDDDDGNGYDDEDGETVSVVLAAPLVVVMFDGILDLNFCCLLCGLSTV